jgi:hypothetical protein
MKHLGYIIACFVILLNVQLVKAQVMLKKEHKYGHLRI